MAMLLACLLRPRCERPRRRAAEQRDEIATFNHLGFILSKAGEEFIRLARPRAARMILTAMRGAVALPGSKATSPAKGSHRNLGDLVSGRQDLRERDGPHREGEEL
jgi:hypothetical protein